MQLKFFLICICTLTLFSNTFPASGQESKRFSWNGAIKTRMQGDYQTGNQAANRFVYGFFLNGTLRLTERIDVIGRLMSGNNRKIASSGWLNYSDLFVPKSSLISSICSVPTETLTIVGSTPAESCSLSVNC